MTQAANVYAQALYTLAKDEGLGKTVLEELSLDEYQQFSPLFDEELYEAIDLMGCVEKRISEGGTSVSSVEAQIAYVKELLAC